MNATEVSIDNGVGTQRLLHERRSIRAGIHHIGGADDVQSFLIDRPRGEPVGLGQQRRPAQLPVLTMVTGYSRWLSGQLIPTRAAPDLFAGWWQVIERLGPRLPRGTTLAVNAPTLLADCGTSIRVVATPGGGSGRHVQALTARGA